MTAGMIGPLSIGGFYIDNLLTQDKQGKFMVTPDIKKKMREMKVKQKSQLKKSYTQSLSSLGSYLNRRFVHPSLLFIEGKMCPVARISPDTETSGIDMLSNSFLHIFKLLRETRKEEI